MSVLLMTALIGAAAFGAGLLGAYVSGVISENVIAIVFSIVLLLTAAQSFRAHVEHIATTGDPVAVRLRLGSTYPTAHGVQRYEVQRVPLGFAIMFGAGALSAVLGIGSGIVKVLAMDRAMRLPFKVSTTTSNFMIGVTAAASAGVYLHRGQIDPTLSFPVMIGVLAGALVGAKILSGADTRSLRLVFTIVVVIAAIEMMYKGITGNL